jgi:alpha-ketoglutaric semialdehyde dehydrogenase
MSASATLEELVMHLHGKNLIGGELAAAGEKTFKGFDPKEGAALEPNFYEATPDEVNRALDLAGEAAAQLRRSTSEEIAELLLGIREEIAAIGDALIDRAARETALDPVRLKGERDRTLNQIKLFADVVREGSWVDARIDTALPERKPLPRPDIRRMLQPIGPVAVFGASNFPLAFSVAGGDTASALAARNPVVVKAHPAHPGTSELVANAIVKAVKAKSMHPGVFALLQSTDPSISLALVSHPRTKAVGFTGSLRAGRALFDAAAKRPDPIPVYAEMGSVNPVFVLPGAMQSKGAQIADGLFKSVTLGTGQFCTNPGLVFVRENAAFDQFRSTLAQLFKDASPGTMLNPPIRKGYTEKVGQFARVDGVEAVFSQQQGNESRSEGQPALFVTSFDTWSQNHLLHEEAFGPATVLVLCRSDADFSTAAEKVEGTLTATLQALPEELGGYTSLIDKLSRVAGRLVVNGFPTGVEVSYAMHHGGPYPATTDEKFTSVGTAAIYRFARPVCYQGFPDQLLPPELRNSNPRNIMRTVDGTLTRDPIPG